MGEKSDSTVWALTLLLAVFLQVAFVFADSVDTPDQAAIAFTKAYFRLDPAMADRICEARRTVDDVDVVDELIHRKTQEAKARGFDLSWMQYGLIHVETTALSHDASQATIHLSAGLRKRINPVYAWVANIFALGEVHHIEEELEMVKEGGRWKVCGNPFDLPVL